MLMDFQIYKNHTTFDIVYISIQSSTIICIIIMFRMAGSRQRGHRQFSKPDCRLRVLDPWETKLVHLHGQLEDIIQAFALGLCFGNSVSPNIAESLISLLHNR